MACTQLAWATGAVTASDAASCVGRVCTVEGQVANVVTSRNNTTVINFGRPYPRQVFSAVISADSSLQFHSAQIHEGSRVRITGLVKMHKGHPEAILDHPSQLAAVD